MGAKPQQTTDVCCWMESMWRTSSLPPRQGTTSNTQHRRHHRSISGCCSHLCVLLAFYFGHERTRLLRLLVPLPTTDVEPLQDILETKPTLLLKVESSRLPNAGDVVKVITYEIVLRPVKKRNNASTNGSEKNLKRTRLHVLMQLRRAKEPECKRCKSWEQLIMCGNTLTLVCPRDELGNACGWISLV